MSSNDLAARRAAYWSENITVLSILLGVWALVSYGAGILFVDVLNSIKLAGFPLGFWFAQQGAIFTFVGIIFVYVVLMNRMDKKYGLEDDESLPPPVAH